MMTGGVSPSDRQPRTAFRKVLAFAGREGRPHAASESEADKCYLAFLIPAEVACRSCGCFFPSSLLALVDPGPEGVGGLLMSLEQAGERFLCAKCSEAGRVDMEANE